MPAASLLSLPSEVLLEIFGHLEFEELHGKSSHFAPKGFGPILSNELADYECPYSALLTLCRGLAPTIRTAWLSAMTLTFHGDIGTHPLAILARTGEDASFLRTVSEVDFSPLHDVVLDKRTRNEWTDFLVWLAPRIDPTSLLLQFGQRNSPLVKSLLPGLELHRLSTLCLPTLGLEAVFGLLEGCCQTLVALTLWPIRDTRLTPAQRQSAINFPRLTDLVYSVDEHSLFGEENATWVQSGSTLLFLLDKMPRLKRLTQEGQTTQEAIELLQARVWIVEILCLMTLDAPFTYTAERVFSWSGNFPKLQTLCLHSFGDETAALPPYYIRTLEIGRMEINDVRDLCNWIKRAPEDCNLEEIDILQWKESWGVTSIGNEDIAALEAECKNRSILLNTPDARGSSAGISHGIDESAAA